MNPPAFSAAAFAELQRDFWFKGVVATTKVVRGDPLIALHLALDMLRDCCVLAMVLRDRATGTTIHRDSPLGREAVQHIAPLGRPLASGDILSLVEQAAIAFDDLAGRWSSGYAARRGPLLRAIAHARRG